MRIAIALSGGVDSAVAALILRGDGHDVVGVTMTLAGGECSVAANDDAAGAAGRAARHLGIAHHLIELSEPFRRFVIEPFLREYAAGRTPNPCVGCNESLKFGLLMDAARSLGAERLATGHHARVARRPAAEGGGGRPCLLRGRDRAKDQSYFLHRLSSEQLDGAVMPVGELTKAEVRRIATREGLAPLTGRESADICFARGGLPDFMRREAPELLEPGPVVDLGGREVGRHEGIALYTVGQRSGLGIALGEPVYVVRIDAERRALVVGPERSLLSGSLEARRLVWTAGRPPGESFRAEAQIRLASRPAACTVRVEGDRANVTFEDAQRAIAPGQSVVFYQGDEVLGGGVIERVAGGV